MFKRRPKIMQGHAWMAWTLGKSKQWLGLFSTHLVLSIIMGVNNNMGSVWVALRLWSEAKPRTGFAFDWGGEGGVYICGWCVVWVAVYIRSRSLGFGKRTSNFSVLRPAISIFLKQKAFPGVRFFDCFYYTPLLPLL